jgi:hypothetical protein
MTDVVNKSSADESEEKQQTVVINKKHCLIKKFNMSAVGRENYLLCDKIEDKIMHNIPY